MSNIKPIRFNKKQQVAFTTPAHEILYGGSRAGGKGSANDSIVMTPHGPKRFGDLKIGSLISNPDGSVASVVAISPDEEYNFYRVTFSDKTFAEVTEGHLWLAWRGEDSAQVVTTPNLKKWCDIAIQQQEQKRKYKNWPLIPVCQEQPFHVDCGSKPDIDPYFFGLLLGGDYLSEKTLRISGMMGIQNSTRFIPKQFKYGSIKTRYAILQGLFDRDGCVEIHEENTGEIIYSTDSKSLAEDIKFVVQSLGGIVTIHLNKEEENKEDSFIYVLHIKFPFPEKLFRLSEKRDKAQCITPQSIYRRVISVELIGKKIGHCITVSHPNGLYMMNDFIVTHNSFLIRYASILYSLAVPGLQTYLFRRNVKDLKKNHLSGHESFLAILHPFVKKEQCKINQTDLRIDFKNGSQIHLCHCQHDKDVEKYRGAEIHFLLIDESTQFTPYQIDFLRTNVRTGGFVIDYTKARKTLPFMPDGFFPRIMYATNPGGPSHCMRYGEVLTNNGWKDIKNMQIGDIVYSINRSSLELETKKVTQTFEYFVNEDLIRVKHKQIDIEFTQNHGIPYFPDLELSKSVTIKPFNELPDQANVLRAPPGQYSEGIPYDTFTVANEYFKKRQRLNQPLTINYRDYAALSGWMISEGRASPGNSFFDIYQSKKQNRKQIESLLNRIGLKYSSYKNYYRIYSYEWAQHFSEQGYCENKCIPKDLLNSTDIDILFENLIAGSGFWKSSDSGVYSTYSIQLRDDFMELCVKLGYICNYKIYQKKNGTLPIQQIYFYKTKTNSTEICTGNKIYKTSIDNLGPKPNISRIPYKGNVYCIEVEDNHNFVCRQGSHVWISGNSYFKSGWMKPQHPPMTVFQAQQDEGGMDRIYVPAQITDNVDLMDNDPTYMTKLMGLGEDHEVRAMLYGDWDALGGDAFGDIWDPKIHIVEPFVIPKTWYIDRTFDWGSSHPFATVWWAESDGSSIKIWDPEAKDWNYKTYPEGTIFAIAEDYGCMTGKVNKGLKLTAREVGSRIREKELWLEEQFDFDEHRIFPGAADGRVFDTQYGTDKKQSIHDNLLMGYESVKTERYPDGKLLYELFSKETVQYSGSRIKSFELLRTYLKAATVIPGEDPGLFIFSTCKYWIETVPFLSRDKDNVDDVDSSGIDHLYDLTRYRLFTKKKRFTDIKVSGI